MRRVRFHGTEYILVGDLASGGAIATADAYRHLERSYAHLYPDGCILQDARQIGQRDDLEDLGETDIEPTDEAFGKMFRAVITGELPWRGHRDAPPRGQED